MPNSIAVILLCMLPTCSTIVAWFWDGFGMVLRSYCISLHLDLSTIGLRLVITMQLQSE